MLYSTKIAVISVIIAVSLISTGVILHFKLSNTEKAEIQTGLEQNENPKQELQELEKDLKSELETNINENYKPTLPSYIKMNDGIQTVIINATEFKFTPSDIQIHSGMTKFVVVNNGVGEHELVMYEESKRDIVDKAEKIEDEETIKNNIILEVEEVKPGTSGESEVVDLKEGTYVIGCHIPGHYESGMKGKLVVG